MITVTNISHALFADADYRGSIHAIFENGGDTVLELRRGTPYVQLIPVAYFAGPAEGGIYEVSLPRGEGRFGSTEARLAQERSCLQSEIAGRLRAEQIAPIEEDAVGSARVPDVLQQDGRNTPESERAVPEAK